jgi:hypothetical protein
VLAQEASKVTAATPVLSSKSRFTVGLLVMGVVLGLRWLLFLGASASARVAQDLFLGMRPIR